MNFEFDPQKSEANQQKHGINFVDAQRLWEDEDRIVFPARTLDEERFVLVGILDGKHWSAIYTVRGENTRIISVRRARDEEVILYES